MVIYSDINLEKCLPELEEISLLLGYPSSSSNGFTQTICELLQETIEHCDIKAGFRYLQNKVISISDTTVENEHFKFEVGTTICRQLQGAESVAIFAATLGPSFDSWSKAAFAKNDPLTGYIIDTIGSAFIEKVIDQVGREISLLALERKMGCTNRFSPGYCGWNVIEQHKLFDCLPAGFCNIKLTDTALMTPMKSVSGIIGVGSVQKQPYTCLYCTQKNCTKRKV